MRHLYLIHASLTLLILTTCDREFDNLWDEKSALAPESWSPSNLQIEGISITERKLTWSYADHHIEGFRIDRKKGDDQWQDAIATLPKEARSWNDTEIFPDPSLRYFYRLYAFAGKNNSTHKTTAFIAAFPPPTHLKLEKISDVSYKLMWTDNSIGEEGFRIDRKTGTDEWEIAFGEVGADQTEFIDENVFSQKKSTLDVQYRVYAWYRTYESEKTSMGISAQIPAPNNLEIEINSPSSVTLTWQENSEGEEGFKIDRRVGQQDWNIGYALADSNQTSYTDNNVTLDGTNSYAYRVYAYSGSYISEYAEAGILPPEVNTLEVTDITDSTALSGGNVISGNGFPVIARGVVWGTSENPTLEQNEGYTLEGEGEFTSRLTGLSPGKTYYVRAYATNIAGTAYGNQQEFAVSAIIPTVITAGIISITQTSATGAGSVSSDGGYPVTVRGIVWGTSANPSLDENTGFTENGEGEGEFTSQITGLTRGTTYYVRAYATNSQGTAYGSQEEFITAADRATVTTHNITNIKATTATSGGEVTSDGGTPVTGRGVVWSISANPDLEQNNGFTENGSSVGEFISNLTGLVGKTTYYVRAYATNNSGTAYGEQKSFTTLEAATVTTAGITDITSTTATSGGWVTSSGGSPVTARGVCWSTNENPTIAGSKTNDGGGTGQYTSSITGLTSGTAYYVRAYATNENGTAYGEQVSLTTHTTPQVTTLQVTDITHISAKGGGEVTFDGYTNVTERGVCWSTNQTPTINNNRTSGGEGRGTFDSDITGLEPNTTYYLRAYATNSVGTSYGDQVSFTTGITMATLTTSEVGNITLGSATSGGNISHNGGSNVTARGLCWSISENPTLDDNHTFDGTGSGGYTSTLSGLDANMTYYVRAYATNSAGTSYGNQLSFLSSDGLPKLTTAAISRLTSESAVSGGNITSDEGFPVTTRGVVWHTSANPTITNHLGITDDGSGTGSFNSNLSGMDQNTNYYVRAYAINSIGTTYGNQDDFTTLKDWEQCGDYVSFTYRGQSIAYNTVYGENGTCWMDRNMGASRVATAYNDSLAYGDQFQWGRDDDGHQLRTSKTTTTLSNSDNPSHSEFITDSTPPWDWRSPQNDNLWQGDGSINDICPAGWRVPTETELNNERQSWVSNDRHGAYASSLRLVAGGYRENDGFHNVVGSYGYYWSSSINGSYARLLHFRGDNANVGNAYRVYGISVRCIRDD